MVVRVQEAAIRVGEAVEDACAGRLDVGAVATFVGLVRDLRGGELQSLHLEHYPGMTEKALQDIEDQARRRWAVQDVVIIHRYGTLLPTEPIVLVAVTAAHRAEAFEACEFIMDFLKTGAPFWKKERSRSGERWVEARDSDDAAVQRWARGAGS